MNLKNATDCSLSKVISSFLGGNRKMQWASGYVVSLALSIFGQVDQQVCSSGASDGSECFEPSGWLRASKMDLLVLVLGK